MYPNLLMHSVLGQHKTTTEAKHWPPGLSLLRKLTSPANDSDTITKNILFSRSKWEREKPVSPATFENSCAISSGKLPSNFGCLGCRLREVFKFPISFYISQILEFSRGNSSHVVVVKILFDAQRKIRRAFTVHLSPDFTGHSELGRKKVIVYIEQPSRNPAVTFPLPPRVVSLRDYDDVSGAESEMIKGYPLICVTVSNYSDHFYFCWAYRYKWLSLDSIFTWRLIQKIEYPLFC